MPLRGETDTNQYGVPHPSSIAERHIYDLQGTWENAVCPREYYVVEGLRVTRADPNGICEFTIRWDHGTQQVQWGTHGRLSLRWFGNDSIAWVPANLTHHYETQYAWRWQRCGMTYESDVSDNELAGHSPPMTSFSLVNLLPPAVRRLFRRRERAPDGVRHAHHVEFPGCPHYHPRSMTYESDPSDNELAGQGLPVTSFSLVNLLAPALRSLFRRRARAPDGVRHIQHVEFPGHPYYYHYRRYSSTSRLRGGDPNELLACGLTQYEVHNLLSRDLTPDDYDVLLRLDDAVRTPKPAMSTDSVQNLPKVTSEVFLGDRCTVCQSLFEVNDTVVALRCGHTFHADCITTWLTTCRKTCPLCFGDVFPIQDGI